VNIQEATMVTMEVPAGEVVGWTEGRNLLLMAPICVVGIEVPAWWSRRKIEKGLQLCKEDLKRWGKRGEKLQSNVLGMMDHIQAWWPLRSQDATPPDSSLHDPQEESPRSPDPESPTEPRDTSDSESEVVEISDISMSDSELQEDIEHMWEEVNKYST
jgi:hypothetical protein